MFRQRSGASLCYRCGKLNAVSADACFYCGAPRPGLWGFGRALGRLGGRLSFARLVIIACGVAYLAALALDPGALARPRGLFSFLSPSSAALDTLGMTGAYALGRGRWWTLVTAIYLHGGLLHILFNMLMLNQLAPVVEEEYGQARLFVIFTAAGVLGFLVSDLAGVAFTIGASGAVFGLLGAMVRYGQSRGGTFGVAVLRQYGQWALVLFVLAFLMPGVNNWAHGGGFAGGFLAAWALRHREQRPDLPFDGLLATAVLALTLLCFALALYTALSRF
ncbi:MAG: rhomboid family intramembrane serine protease [Candidatus Rokubacteria bacterium]|nr:rhomboid family intramembrane serine protease [Candidatus Rokubacteria bacterium]